MNHSLWERFKAWINSEFYLNFLLIPRHYARLLDHRSRRFDWGLPALLTVSIAVWEFLVWKPSMVKIREIWIGLLSMSQSTIGILLAFSVASLSILASGSSKNMEAMKEHLTTAVISGKRVSFFRLTLANLSYLIIAQVATLIMSYVLTLLGAGAEGIVILGLFHLNFFALLHILFLTVRCIVDLYFALFPEK